MFICLARIRYNGKLYEKDQEIAFASGDAKFKSELLEFSRIKEVKKAKDKKAK